MNLGASGTCGNQLQRAPRRHVAPHDLRIVTTRSRAIGALPARAAAVRKLAISLSLALACGSLQADMSGSADHPKIPRIAGTTIHGYLKSEFDEGRFVTGFTPKTRKLDTNKAGGVRTRIFYLASPDVSPAQVVRNYRVAAEALGDAKLVYECEEKCPSNLGSAFVWASANRVPTDLPGSGFEYAPLGYSQQRYAYWQVASGASRYHISVFTAYLNGIQQRSVRKTRAIHVDIVEEGDFKATLEVVTPDEITKRISEKGSIALYGILFDLDSAALKDESIAALDSVAAALKKDQALKIYVVGHTDNQGSYDHNLDLARRRAESVVSYLTQKHAVAASRLRAVGVGPVAPVASNRSSEGQALNRRVELVEF